MKSTVGVFTLGPLLDEYTLQSISNAKKITEVQQKNKIMENKYTNKDGQEVESTLNNMNEIKDILNKTGLKKYFPFKPVKNKNGEIDFVPKGENLKEIKKDIETYKEKMEEALKKGKITQEEYAKLEQNLDELMEENDIDLEEAQNIEVTDEEVNDYLNAIIYRNFGNNFDLDGIKEKYEDASLDEKEAFLTKFNSEVNKKLGISGKISFTSDPEPIPFENSFNADGKGYTLSRGDIDVSADQLKNVLYGMVERSLIRKAEIERGAQMSPDKKKALHDKMMRDKEKREQEKQRQEDKYNKKVARQRIRMLERE